ncbi:hypothetical protein pb186bvf_016765 [Paramecium bursaria]
MIIEPSYQNLDCYIRLEYQIKQERWNSKDCLTIIENDLKQLLWEYADAENIEILIAIIDFIEDGIEGKKAQSPFAVFKGIDLRYRFIGEYINKFLEQLVEQIGINQQGLSQNDYRKMDECSLDKARDLAKQILRVKFYSKSPQDQEMLDKLIEMVNLLIGPPDARMEKKRKLVKL